MSDESSADLQAAFAAQLNLQIDSYGANPLELMEEDRIEFIRWNVLALEDELHEALAETGWKPWATSRHINTDKFHGELVDAFHFFMNLCLVSGLTADQLLERYFEKRSINAKRQARGYDGVEGKCPKCRRALDDPTVVCKYNPKTGLGWCQDLGAFSA